MSPSVEVCVEQISRQTVAEMHAPREYLGSLQADSQPAVWEMVVGPQGQKRLLRDFLPLYAAWNKLWFASSLQGRQILCCAWAVEVNPVVILHVIGIPNSYSG